MSVSLLSHPFNFIKIYVSSLLTDPKSRKVILVEHPLLPLYIKDALAKVLFGNLQVRLIASYPGNLFKNKQDPFCIICFEPFTLAPFCRSYHGSCYRLRSSRIYSTPRWLHLSGTFFRLTKGIADICCSTLVSPPSNNTFSRCTTHISPPCSSVIVRNVHTSSVKSQQCDPTSIE